MDSNADSPLATFAVSRSVAVEWAALGTAGFVVALFALGGLYATVTGQSEAGFSFSLSDTHGALVNLALALLLSGGVIVVHELVHGVVMSHYGGRPSYGAGVAHFVLPYAYATSDTAFSRNQFIVIALAPVVVITAVGVPVMFALSWPALLLPLALNIGGAVGDLWMVTTLRRFPTSVTVVDDATGLSVYGDAADTPPAQPRGVVRAAAMGFGVSVGILILLALLAPILLDVAGVTALSLGPPETPWSIFQFESGPDGFSSSLGLGGILGVSGAVGLAYGLFAAGRTPTA